MISTLLTTAAAAAAGPRNFLAFGDSWAWLGFEQFKDALAPHGINASRHAIPGTPAGYWAWAQPQALVDAVDAANADAVYLSIGGNDFLEGLPAGHHVETLFEEMMASTRLVLTRLFEQRPHVHVFHFGYELLNWNSCGVCEAFGHEELHGSASRGMCPDTSNVTCMTYSQAEFLQRRFIDEGLAREFASNAHYHPLNLLGTLQVAGGVPGARVGAPVWSQYAPSQFVHKADGMWSCVHLTAKGYGALYAELLKHALPALRASASASGDATSRAAGRVEQQGVEQGLVEAGRLRRANEAPCVSNAQRQCWHLAPQTTASAA
jgi:lysophospholipase L1-like esterase